MLEVLSKKRVFIVFGILTFVLFFAVMFFVNPYIDGNDGMSVIALQVAFDKSLGIDILNTWGRSGIERYKKFIIFDYLYALSYSVFFSSLIARLIVKKSPKKWKNYGFVLSLPFIAGLSDWVENSLEISFLNDISGFNDKLFTIHSFIASLKWMILPIVLWLIVKSLFRIKRI